MRTLNFLTFFLFITVTLFAVELPETSTGWVKYENNPVLGGAELGTCFDIAMLQEDGKFKMWFSWRPKKSLAYTESKDGISWSEPKIVLAPNPDNDWENDINRPGIVKRDDVYHLWYTGQAKGKSYIGYATSRDGLTWKRQSDKPVLSAEKGWEKEIAVMCPHVEWDADVQLYKMWYSGGEQYEPNAIGYATSKDGLAWTKYPQNPVFAADKKIKWEHHKVTAAQIIKHGGWYLMFYIGFEHENLARIGLARSKDGITNWERLPTNPIIGPGKGAWDEIACYKPFAIYAPAEKQWRLWYNGRNDKFERIGLATHDGEDLGFPADGDTKPEQPSAVRLSDVSGEQIPLLGWHGIASDSSPERYRDMTDAGFTINLAPDLHWGNLPTIFKNGSEQFFNSLDTVAAVKMKIFVGADVFQHIPAEDITRLKAHPGLFGYYVKDEPRSASEFPKLKKRIQEVQTFDTEHPCYINLAPALYRPDKTPDSWAPELTCGPEWEEPSPFVIFVRKFIKDVPVPILSFDMYPIWLNTNTNQRELQVRWYYTLEVMSAEAKKANKPLWAFVLSTAHKNLDFPYPVPTLNDLRLQAYSDLAYGAQCIQYFTYDYVRDPGWEAPLASDRTKTATYHTVKAMNAEIKALSPVFLNSKMIWTAHTGEIPAGCTELDKTKLPTVFRSLDIKGGKGALVSLMEKGNDNFLVIVNHDINEDITIQASGTADLNRVKKDGSVVIADNRIHTLTPGDVLIYFWKRP